MYATLEDFKDYLEIDHEEHGEDAFLNLLLVATSEEIDTFTSGSLAEMDELPESIKLYCITLAAMKYNRKGSEEVESETIGKLSTTYTKLDMPLYIRKALERYRGHLI